ncbi:MAG TPA: shikimate kinase, partial [Pyrinomonadaceae bacterium]|nr:shikimate kinase [Pyrinomonadaceae bacterium]
MKTDSPIVITGFMAAGKTTVAEALARLTSGRMIDLDRKLCESEGCTIRAFIEENGETLFREAETRALRNVLEDKTVSVVALGGGTWTIERNRALIARHCCRAVWLDAPFKLCWQRITEEENEKSRPLASDYVQTKRLY